MTSMCYDTVPKSIEELMRHFGCSVHDLPETLSLESPILAFKAVMTQSKKIVNLGDFVKVTSPRVRPILFTSFYYNIMLFFF